MTSLLRSQTNKAESLRSIFVVMHNLSFQTSDHASKLFCYMFLYSEVAKKFSSGHIKTAAVIKEALAPYYHEGKLSGISKFFSIMMDESNNKTDHSFMHYPCPSPRFKWRRCRTRFLDMPILEQCELISILSRNLTKGVRVGIDVRLYNCNKGCKVRCTETNPR